MYLSVAKINKEVIGQFSRFAVVGVSNTAIDFGIYFVLTRLVPFFFTHIYIANALAFVGATIWSYSINRTWTFKSQTKMSVEEFGKFFTTTASGFLLNTLVLFILVQYVGVYDLLAKIAAVAASTMWNFMLTKRWVFNQSPV